jgi:prevent-host-death family protein
VRFASLNIGSASARSGYFTSDRGYGASFGDRREKRRGDMAESIRKSRVKQVSLSEIKDDLSRYLREAERQEIIITRHGKPAGILIGFESEDDWFEYRLEHDPRFLRRIGEARESLRAGRGTCGRHRRRLNGIPSRRRRFRPNGAADRGSELPEADAK